MFNGKYDLCEPLPEYPQGDVTTECKLLHICVLTFLIYILNNNILSQVIKSTSCLPMVSGSLRVPWLLSPLKLKVALNTINQIKYKHL
jgi:hypothetical protein